MTVENFKRTFSEIAIFVGRCSERPTLLADDLKNYVFHFLPQKIEFCFNRGLMQKTL